MKNQILLLLCSIIFHPAVAQLKTTPVCPVFTVDVLYGTINDINPKSTLGEVKTSLACFTEVLEKDSSGKCAGVFYKEKDIFFYTSRNYVEIREKFKGKLSLPIMGASRAGLFKWLGYPKIKDTNWDAFQTRYGTLILYYNKAAKVNKIQMSSKTTETLKLCE